MRAAGDLCPPRTRCTAYWVIPAWVVRLWRVKSAAVQLRSWLQVAARARRLTGRRAGGVSASVALNRRCQSPGWRVAPITCNAIATRFTCCRNLRARPLPSFDWPRGCSVRCPVWACSAWTALLGEACHWPCEERDPSPGAGAVSAVPPGPWRQYQPQETSAGMDRATLVAGPGAPALPGG